LPSRASSNLSAWLHAFFNGLFRPSEEQLTRETFDRVVALLQEHGLTQSDGRQALIEFITDDVVERVSRKHDHVDHALASELTERLLDYEEMFEIPKVDWSERRSVSELWALRDALNVQKKLLEDFDGNLDLFAKTMARALHCVLDASPVLDTKKGENGICVPTSKLDMLRDLSGVVEGVMAPCLDDEIFRHDLFPRLRERLDRNLISASGGNPDDPKGFTRTPKPPTKSDITGKRELVGTYLGGTPLTRLFDGALNFTIPTRTRFEHQHIIAGSGHGKTQTLQYLIANDLPAVESGQASIIVLDSQGDLIRTISQLKCFAPGEPLHERICIIDPSDVEYPVSLNLFDVGMERLQNYPMLERERLTNSILELYDFVLGSLLSAEMTQKQNVIFRYVTRLMLHIPDATIHTLRELMEPGSEKKFAPYIETLTGTARQFFETEFSSREFNDTKKQVLRRLWGILENQTFERMFSHPRSKLDLFSEMNSGKVILINTAKDLLKETGTEIFGRFFIALIAQAAQERATLPESKRLPTFVYIDEAADYFDRNIGLILSQARKQKIGMVLAHQYLGQLDPKLQEAFGANTAIKFAGGVSNKDARALAPMLGCTPEFIESQPKGSFAASVRGLTTTALPLRFELGTMEKLPRMSKSERQALQEEMRRRYAVHYSELSQPAVKEGSEPEQTDDAPPLTETDPPKPSFKPKPKPVKKDEAIKPDPENLDRPNTDPSPTW
jgi:hypothetical protein